MLQKRIETEKQLAQIRVKQTEEILKVKAAQKEADRIQKEATKSVKAELDAYGKLSKEFSVAAREAKNYELTLGKTNKTTIEAKAYANGLNDKLKALDAGTGQYTRNVGNYHGSMMKYAKGLRGFGGLVKLVAEIFGIETGSLEAWGKGIQEAGKSIKEFEHVKHAVTKEHAAGAHAIKEEIGELTKQAVVQEVVTTETEANSVVTVASSVATT